MTAVAYQDIPSAAAADVMQRYQADPAAFFRDVLGAEPWPLQEVIAESVRDNEETAVPSCHSSGKSWDAARIILWFLSCFYRSVVITTAPTKRQVEGILWKEIGAAHKSSLVPLGGELSTTRLKLDVDWYAWGFTAPEYDPNRFQGFHAPHILIVEDEAAGISATIAEQIDSLMAGGHARRLKIGNPTDPYSPFKESCDDGETNVIPISCYDTPNFTGFGITESDIESGAWVGKVGTEDMPRPELITPKWVAQRMRRWGKDSPSYVSRCKGEFPDEVEGSYFGAQMRRADKEDRITSVEIETDLPTWTAWDLGMDDEMVIWVAQFHGLSVRLVDYYANSGEGLTHYAGWLKRWSKEHDVTFDGHYAPHDIEVRELGTGVTRLETAARLGVAFTVVPKLQKAEQIEAARNLIGRCWYDKVRTAPGVKGLRQYKKEQDQKTGLFLGRPVHDEASHPSDAFMVLAVGRGRDDDATTSRGRGRVRRGPGGL